MSYRDEVLAQRGKGNYFHPPSEEGLMMDLHIDVETFSVADLPKVGHYRYAQDPSTRVLLLAWAVDDEPVQVIDLYHRESLPLCFLQLFSSPHIVKYAHNAAFERAILWYVLGLHCPPEEWRCTAVWARSLALPAGLGQLAKVVGAKHQKMETDKRLVTLMCTPKRGGPQAHQHLWPEFKTYNVIDVEAERDIARKLRQFPMPLHEWRLWALDQKINDRGMPIDVPFVRRAALAAQQNADEVTNLVKDATDMANPGSRAQWLAWLRTKDIEAPNLTRATLDAMRNDATLPDDTRTILDMRRELTSTSVAKFDTLLRSVGNEDRVRGSYTFYGAGRTGRWSGKMFQPHNLPRGILKEAEIPGARELIERRDLDTVRMLWPEVSPVIASLIRTAIAAPKGRKLAAADLSSIETVMLGWAAGCEPILDVFRTGKDAYKQFGTYIFHTAYEEITKAQRTLSKPAVLGCGYGMGWRGLMAYALSFGVVLTPEEAKAHVATYRATYRQVVTFWEDVENAAFSAVETGATERVGPFTFQRRGGFLFIVLPSGRSLAYFQPRIREGRFGKEMQYLSGAEYSKQLWLSTYGAKLVENIVQAISRDVLAAGMMRADAAGLDIIMHVHDEIVIETDEDDMTALPTLIECMTRRLSWCPDAPIAAAGWQGKLYRKD